VFYYTCKMKNVILFFACALIATAGFAQVQQDSSSYIKVLAQELDSIRYNDQGDRGILQQMVITGIKDSALFYRLVAKVKVEDSVDLGKVEHILDTYGWLGPQVVGTNGNIALFLVIQHSSLKVQEKYLPMMKPAVKRGNASVQNFALLEDKVKLREGHGQVYGSQMQRDTKTGNVEPLPIDDPDNLDKRRAEIGLQSMADFCRLYQLKWDLDRYKKGLPLEKISN